MFTWRAIYKDGSVYDYDPDKFNIANVNQDKLNIFQIRDVESTIPLLSIHFDDPRKRLIYVRRVEKNSSLPHPLIQHIVGWQMNVNGENVQSLMMVFETIIVSWKGEPQKSEKIERHLHWIENIGKYDRKRDSHFYSPSPKQLKIIGSNVT